ncbi:hypothetical protein [Paraglaciecola sp.]|uniref:hypothetical protein n=1 Tax=Paraglaciecola sp. TaxID=1920173 RepID=UPI0030F3D90C
MNSQRDLQIAATEIQKMKLTQSFDDFKESWENYLFRLERAWERAERALNDSPGFQQWCQPYSSLRKKDSLLQYLKQARNAEMHSICESISRRLKISIVDKSGRGLALDSISHKLENGLLTISLESPDLIFDVDAQLVPTNPELVKIKCRGNWYNPPWSHLNEKIIDIHPVYIAEMGLNFYKAFVDEAEIWTKK